MVTAALELPVPLQGAVALEFWTSGTRTHPSALAIDEPRPATAGATTIVPARATRTPTLLSRDILDMLFLSYTVGSRRGIPPTFVTCDLWGRHGSRLSLAFL